MSPTAATRSRRARTVSGSSIRSDRRSSVTTRFQRKQSASVFQPVRACRCWCRCRRIISPSGLPPDANRLLLDRCGASGSGRSKRSGRAAISRPLSRSGRTDPPGSPARERRSPGGHAYGGDQVDRNPRRALRWPIRHRSDRGRSLGLVRQLPAGRPRILQMGPSWPTCRSAVSRARWPSSESVRFGSQSGEDRWNEREAVEPCRASEDGSHWRLRSALLAASRDASGGAERDAIHLLERDVARRYDGVDLVGTRSPGHLGLQPVGAPAVLSAAYANDVSRCLTASAPSLSQIQPRNSIGIAGWLRRGHRLRPGIHYGPPFENVEVTAADIARALLRSDGEEATGLEASTCRRSRDFRE